MEEQALKDTLYYECDWFRISIPACECNISLCQWCQIENEGFMCSLNSVLDPILGVIGMRSCHLGRGCAFGLSNVQIQQIKSSAKKKKKFYTLIVESVSR